jgi:hypothetical protein
MKNSAIRSLIRAQYDVDPNTDVVVEHLHTTDNRMTDTTETQFLVSYVDIWGTLYSFALVVVKKPN